MSDIRIENIQHVYLANKAATLFDVFVKEVDEYGREVWVFDRQDSLKGTIKRESTIIRKINAQ